MNYSESTSWGKGFIAFLSVNKLLPPSGNIRPFVKMGPVRKYKAIHSKINNKATYSWTMNDNLTPEILIFHMYCILVCFLSPQITICGCEKRSFLSITSARAFVIPGREYVCCFVVLSSSNNCFSRLKLRTLRGGAIFHTSMLQDNASLILIPR